VAVADLNSWMLLPGLLLAGAGNGFFLAPNVQFIVATVDNAEAGAASGVVQTVQRMGTAIGVAIIGSILFGALTPDKMVPGLIGQAFKDGAAGAMLTSAIMAVAAFFLVFTLPKRIQLHGAPSAAPAGD